MLRKFLLIGISQQWCALGFSNIFSIMIHYKSYCSQSTTVVEIHQYKDLIKESVTTNTSVKNVPNSQALNNWLTGDRLYTVLYTVGSSQLNRADVHSLV